MIRAILTDIEGTTTSLSFVKDVLFPYARARMGEFIDTHKDSVAVTKELAEVAALAGKPLNHHEATALLVRWIDEDRKATPLKALQGQVWEAGYYEGDFFGHVYEDAVEKLREWHDAGLQLWVFSSGSVHAQKLLFAHTQYGDLTPLFSGYFDTRIGPKQEPASYAAIAKQMGLPPDTILFLSDIVAELDAAKEAGLLTIRLVRDLSSAQPSRHRDVHTFDEIDIVL